MAKKKIEDFKVDLDTKKVDVHVEKKEGEFKAEVNTEKVDVKFEKGTDGSDFDLDSKKIVYKDSYFACFRSLNCY